MRSLLVRLLLAAVAGLALTFPFACGGGTSTAVTSGAGAATETTAPETAPETPVPFPSPEPGEPGPTEQPSPYGAGTTASQTVGMLIDGLQLRDIRWSDHGSYFRVVFEMGTPDGEPLLQIPHAEASMSPDGKQVRVVLGGIRSIGSSGNVTSPSLNVGDPVVKTIQRLPEGDDQALVYAIELTKPSTYALAGLGSPGRIVIDITKS
jgi:hypothetical protein